MVSCSKNYCFCRRIIINIRKIIINFILYSIINSEYEDTKNDDFDV